MGVSTNMYIRTDRAYVDTRGSFDFCPKCSSTRGRVMPAFDADTLNASCNFQSEWIDFRYINCNAMSEFYNDRWFMGHNSNDCYADAPSYRCVNSGYSSPAFGRWGKMNNIRMW